MPAAPVGVLRPPTDRQRGHGYGRYRRGRRAAGSAAGATLCLLLAAPCAHAGGWDGTLTASTDSLYRGLALNGGRGTLSLDLRWRTDTGWSVFGGVSAWRRESGATTTEVSFGAGRSWQLDGDWTTQVGVAHYGYDGPPQRFVYDYEELNVSLGWRGQWFASLAVSPNTSGPGGYGSLRRDLTWAFELTTRQRLTGRLALDAGIGYFDLHRFVGLTGYPYASVGLSSGFGPVQAYLSFITSRAEARSVAPAPVAGDHWVASVLWSF